MLAPAAALAAVGASTKYATGWWSARRSGIGRRGRLRAGMTLIARGEFSIVLAGLGVAAGIGPELGLLATGYVLILAVVGSLLTNYGDVLVETAGRMRRPASTG